MKQIKRISFFLHIIFSLFLFPASTFAVGNFTSSSGVLVVPEVDVDGNVFYDNVSLKLNFANGTFELTGFSPKPDLISLTPIESMEEKNLKMDFMGCTRSGRNEVTCHVNLTSLGGLDRRTRVYVNLASSGQSLLYDDLGNTYPAKEATVGNISTKSAEYVNLIAGVPTLAKFKFIDVAPNATSLSLFQPLFEPDGNEAKGDFRNINF